MLRALLVTALALGLLAPAPVSAADETYTLKLYKGKKGDKIEHETTEKTKTTVVVSAGGNDTKEMIATGLKEVYTEETLEQKATDKHPTKLSRMYDLAEKTEKDDTKKLAYSGEKVLIERKGDKYEITMRGKPLAESDAPDLHKKFSDKKADEPDPNDLVATDPVKVGGTWTIPADKSEKMFKTLSGDKMKVDEKKSSISGKLLKVYKKDGAQFGVLEITITVVVTEIDFGGGQLTKTGTGSKMVLKGTLDTCIDGTSATSDDKMEMTMEFSAEIPNVGSISLKGTATGTNMRRAAKK